MRLCPPIAMKKTEQCKRELRLEMRRLRDALDDDRRVAIDAAIAQRVCALDAFARAKVLLTYLGVGSEVETLGIIEHAWAAGMCVALPRCIPGTREMRWYRVTSLDGLVRNPWGILEPQAVGENELPSCSSPRVLALVPGLTFDEAGYRLGYGGGFYDTFLASFDGVSVGLCREVQMSASLREEGVIDVYDLPVQLVVTEGRIIS